MKNVLVTGAPGFVGSHLCKELIDAGYNVKGLVRATSQIEQIRELGVEIIEGDITDPDSLKGAFQGIDTVFHIAALFREAKHGDEVYHQVNVEGTRNVFEVAIASGVETVVHCSTVGVHSHIPNPPANEDEAYRPGDIYQHTMCEGEKVAQSFFQSGRIKGAIIRPAMIWGTGDTRTLKLYKGIASQRFPLIGTGKTLVHWIDVDDLSRAMRLAAESREVPPGEVFIISGERPVSMRYMIETIASKFDVSPPRFRIPAFPVQLIGSIVEAICIPFGIEPPIYRRRVDFFTKTRAFDSSKARELLGFKPANSFEDEVGRIAEWYKSSGWV